MGSEFEYFKKTIPPDVYASSKTTICQHIAIFETDKYALGKAICVDDYHFILFFGSAPSIRINNVEYRVKKGDMSVVQPWQEIYGIPGKTKDFGKYLHIA